MKTYHVGVFGIGWVAGEHLKAYVQNPNMKVVALASRRRASAQSAKDRLGLDCDVLETYDELVRREDIDIIDICTPNNTHHDLVLAAAAAGTEHPRVARSATPGPSTGPTPSSSPSWWDAPSAFR